MIHVDLTIEQDAAMCLLVQKALEAARLGMDAMHGQPIDAERATNLLFEGCAAIQVAFPGDLDKQTLRMLLLRTGLGAAFPNRPANDECTPPGAA